ncbi:unnamed protein product [Chrysoparadoxa australica]
MRAACAALALGLEGCLHICKAAPLEVIGAGMGRTGTTTLSHALNILGKGPTYHMLEIVYNTATNPGHSDIWRRASEGDQTTDWDAVFKDYNSAVDTPSCFFYDDLMEKYPKAKVVLTIRPFDEWWASAEKTICHLGSANWARRVQMYFIKWERDWGMMINSMNLKYDRTDFGLRDNYGQVYIDWCKDKEYAEKLYNRWNKSVVETVPKSRLLVFETGKHGWKELCDFLGVPVPDVPYPRANSGGFFRSLLIRQYATAVALLLSPVLLLILVIAALRRCLGEKRKSQ